MCKVCETSMHRYKEYFAVCFFSGTRLSSVLIAFVYEPRCDFRTSCLHGNVKRPANSTTPRLLTSQTSYRLPRNKMCCTDVVSGGWAGRTVRRSNKEVLSGHVSHRLVLAVFIVPSQSAHAIMCRGKKKKKTPLPAVHTEKRASGTYVSVDTTDAECLLTFWNSHWWLILARMIRTGNRANRRYHGPN